MGTTIIGILAGAALFVPRAASAHCPLCTAGAGAAALGAAWLGVGGFAIGVFIGAFAAALGFWADKLLKRKFIPLQAPILVIASFLLTIIPLSPLLTDYTSFMVAVAGDYGTILNRTYLVNLFWAGSVVGGAVLLAAPSISGAVTRLRKGRTIAFQGISITLVTLAALSALGELLL